MAALRLRAAAEIAGIKKPPSHGCDGGDFYEVTA